MVLKLMVPMEVVSLSSRVTNKGSRAIPKYTAFPNDRHYRVEKVYCRHWFINKMKKNIIQLAVVYKNARSSYGVNSSNINWTAIHTGNFIGFTHRIAAISETIVHELGHQFNVMNPHVDARMNVLNHEGTDKCVMSYDRNRDNGIVEFDIDCLYDVRDENDPL